MRRIGEKSVEYYDKKVSKEMSSFVQKLEKMKEFRIWNVWTILGCGAEPKRLKWRSSKNFVHQQPSRIPFAFDVVFLCTRIEWVRRSTTTWRYIQSLLGWGNFLQNFPAIVNFISRFLIDYQSQFVIDHESRLLIDLRDRSSIDLRKRISIDFWSRFSIIFLVLTFSQLCGVEFWGID